MTSLVFRSSPVRCERMRELLSDPTLQEALMAVRDDFIPEEVPEGADALTSIRRHSRNSGAIEYLTRLLLTADAINLSTQTEPPRTYGTEFTADEAP